jgi:uncharacterized protein (DUF1800 family)
MMRLVSASIAFLVAAGLSSGCARSVVTADGASGAGRAGTEIALPPTPLTERQQALHVLSRLGYGPRPGDVERVRAMGVAAYIRRQLDPASIDDEGTESRLASLRTLAMRPAELWRLYPRPDPALLQQMRSGEMGRDEARRVLPLEARPAWIVAELQAARLTRAVLSERQLLEVMVDFWFNHFNVYAGKGDMRWLVTSYERDAIRPHALGRFRDLLQATARHPAMLYYLDNWLSTRDGFTVRGGPAKGRRMGLNENYARELLELHTLGVDGGYTQQDVVEVARCFTGWGIERPPAEGRFVFRPLAHDPGAKTVLGRHIPAGGGESDGLTVLDLLARHPATARFIATKLARRFVSDEPPPAVVERASRIFLDTDGNIRDVLAAILASPEFLSLDAYRAKIKSPLELVASAVRALGAVPTPGMPAPGETAGQGGGASAPGGAYVLARAVGNLGQPLFEAQPPTGYPDRAPAWVGTGTLAARMTFSLRLAHSRVPGVRTSLPPLHNGIERGGPDAAVDYLVGQLLGGEATPETRAILARQARAARPTAAAATARGPGDEEVETLVALVLGSPDFQRR